LKTSRRFFALAFALLLALPFGVHASGTDKEREVRRAPLPFEPAEQLVYEGEFSKFLLRGIKIAEFRFTAGRAGESAGEGKADANTETPQRLLFVGDVTSEGWFRKLFKIDFHFRVESLVEREAFEVVRSKELDEQGKRVRMRESVFDRKGKTVTWTETDPNDPKSPPRVATSPLDAPAHDIVSAIYFLRTQPLTPGRDFDITLSDSGRVYRVPVTVAAEPKAMKTALGRVSVVRVEVGIFGKDRPLEGDGKLTIWMTTDVRRVPVRARMSSDMGQLDIKLKQTAPAAR
jgi:hypothetical protein